MTTPSKTDTVAAVVDALMECSDPNARDRILLDAVFDLGAAEAAAIWKRVPRFGARDGNGNPARWQPTLERGPADLLPDGEDVQGSVTGSIDFELPHRRAVFACGMAPRNVALALGGSSQDESLLDAVEALIQVWGAMHAADADLEQLAEGLLDIQEPLLPPNDLPSTGTEG